MAQYIPLEQLVAEIERRMKEDVSLDGNGGFASYMDFERYSTLESILSFVKEELEVKEVDFEEKATQLSQKYFPDEENIWARTNIEAQKCKSACIEMAEWFKVQKGE